MLEVLRDLLQQIINDIDSGNSNISEDQQLETLDFIQRLFSKELTKVESAQYIGVCRATFDNYVSKGWIPEGIKRQGSSTLFWKKCDLDKFLKTWKKT